MTSTERSRLQIFLLGSFVLMALGLFAPAGAAAAAARRVGPPPPVPSGARAVGALAPSTELTVTVTLQPRDGAALAAYAQAVATPGSADYHHYLTVPQFADRFGATPAELSAVLDELRHEGLNPGPAAANQLSVSVTAPAAAVASALSTQFERYRLPDGRVAYANTVAPQFSASAASVIQGVVGLDDLAVRHPQGLQPSGLATGNVNSGPDQSAPSVATAGAAVPCPSATSTASMYGAWTANQIASAYRYSSLYASGDLGSGTTVALYELEPYRSSDISAYQACYGTQAAVQNVAVDGGASCNGDPYCGMEDVLDIEDVAGLVPKANLSVYEGPNTDRGAYDTYSQIVTANKAKVISTSWGLCEAQEGASAAKAENTLFQEAATQGQSIFAAAGDNGTTDCVNGTTGVPIAQRAVDDPASQPYVTGVGGTTLSSVGPPPGESVWNDGIDGGAGGGGVSSLWTQPSYQSGFALSQSSTTCGAGDFGCREVPDVSADADEDTGYAVVWDGSWTSVGGTSAATPTWASLAALADSSTSCSSAPVGFADPALYRAATTAYNSDFDDITSGNNNFDGVTGFSAGVGYDMASGLGSPNGGALVSALCSGTTETDTVTFRTPPATQTSTVGKPVTALTVAATSSAGATPLTYSATGLPSGLTINSATGAITGTPVTANNYTVTVRAVDAKSVSGTVSFAWDVLNATGTTGTARVTIQPVPNQLGTKGRAVSLQVRATDSAGLILTYAASGLPAGLSINRSTGLISGTPMAAGRTVVNVTVSDTAGHSAAMSFSWSINF